MPLPLDHSKATATISFAGLLLFRPTGPENNRQCEVKVLNCERHKLSITIGMVRFDAAGRELREEIIDPLLNLNEDISISVNEPSEAGIEFCKDAATPFDRKTGKGNKEDVRWVLDIENTELNGEKLEIGPQNVANPKIFSPTILINHCKLYTLLKTDEILAREDILNTNDRVFLGRAAFRIGADLLSKAGKTIRVWNTTVNGSGVELKQADLTQFRITIENDCEIPDDLESGSDFRFYYDALGTAPLGKKYDLRRVIEGGASDPNDPLSGTPPNANFTSDNYPRTCLPGGGGTSK